MERELSIIIPFYNAEKYLYRLLSTICQSKTKYKYEVILIDDGSIDDSYRIVSQFIENYNNIHYFKVDHQGVSHARNVGISKSIGKYICFVDADDMVYPNYIECMINALVDSSDLVVCGYELIDAKKRNRRVLDNCNYTNLSEALLNMELKKRTMVQSIWNKIFIRKIINEHEIQFPEDLSIGEDHSFFLDYCLHIKAIKTISDVLYIHFKNSKSLSNQQFPYLILKQRADKIYQKNKVLLSKFPLERYEKLCMANYTIDTFFSLLQLVSENNNLTDVISELKDRKHILMCDYVYNRRHKLPLIIRIVLKQNSTIVLHLTLLLLNLYYKLIQKRLNT